MKKTAGLFIGILLSSTAQAEVRNSIEVLTNIEVIEHIRSELPAERAIEQRRRTLTIFDSLDSNKDNQVTFREMRNRPGLVRSFHKLDLNNDGVLSRTEMKPLQVEVKGLRRLLSLSALRII